MRFAADENFNNDILRGVLRRYPELDVVRIQDTEVYEAEDPVVLEWVSTAGRILLTHDTRTMPDFAYERVRTTNLTAPVARLNGLHTPTPYSPALEAAVVPSMEGIVQAIRDLLSE